MHHLEHTMLIDAEYTIGSNKWPHSCLGTEMQLSDLIKSIVIYCKCVSVLWTLFFLHAWGKWGHLLRRKRREKISIWFPEEILQEILGFLWQCSQFVTIDVLTKKSFPAYFLWEGAVHVDPLILVCMCIPPVWLESFGSGTDQLWLWGWARAPAACFGYWYVNVVSLCSTVGTSSSQTFKAAEFQCLIWLTRRLSQLLQIQVKHKPARCQSRNMNTMTVQR